MGYLAYECVRYFERLPTPARDDLRLPDAVLMLADTLVVFDHVKHRMRILSHADVEACEGDVERAYGEAEARIEALAERIQAPLSVTHRESERRTGGAGAGRGSRPAGRAGAAIAPLADGPQSTFTRDEYGAAVERAVEYIRAGDIIQVVPSQRLSRPLTAHPFNVYRALRAINPSPYMYLLHLDDTYVVGASPEMLVQVEDGTVRTRPIAGTRPRGENDAEDAALAADLLGDEKERAEHIMLVDLGRNDLGRVCRPARSR